MHIPKLYRSILTLAIPVMISQVGQVVVQLADTIMVGNLGTTQLAGVSFAMALYNPIFVIGLGVAMGLTPLVSRAKARDNSSRIRSLFKNSVLLNTVFGVVLTVVLAGLTLSIDFMGQDPDIVPLAKSYSWLMVATILPMLWFFTVRQLLEGLGNTSWAMIITISGNVLNIVLNFVFIYGLVGAPEMGAIGAGVSTLIARILMAVAMWAVLVRHPKFGMYARGLRSVGIFRFRLLRLWRLGYPIAIQMGVEITAMSAMAVCVGLFGKQMLAAHQIAINIPTFTFMFVVGLANATTVLVARDYELKLFESVRKILRASLVMITGFMIFSAAMFVVFAVPVASIFDPDITVQLLAAHLILFGAMFQITDGVQGITLGALRGLMDVQRPMYYSIFTYIVIGFPVGYVCGFVLGMGASGIWLGFVASIATLAVLYTRRFSKFLAQKL